MACAWSVCACEWFVVERICLPFILSKSVGLKNGRLLTHALICFCPANSKHFCDFENEKITSKPCHYEWRYLLYVHPWEPTVLFSPMHIHRDKNNRRAHRKFFFVILRIKTMKSTNSCVEPIAHLTDDCLGPSPRELMPEALLVVPGSRGFSKLISLEQGSSGGNK